MNYWSTLTLAVTTHHNRVACTLKLSREWAKALAALPLKDPNIDTWKKIQRFIKLPIYSKHSVECAQERNWEASTNPQLYSNDTSIERRVRKLLRSFSKRDIQTNGGTNWFMDFLDNLRISNSKLFYCCVYCSSCSTIGFNVSLTERSQ